MRISIIAPVCSWPDPSDIDGEAHHFLSHFLDSILTARRNNEPDIEVLIGIDGDRVNVRKTIYDWCGNKTIDIIDGAYHTICLREWSGIRIRIFELPFTGHWGNTQRNVLIPNANGDLLHFIDHDDAYTPEALWKISKHYGRNLGRPIVARMRIHAYKNVICDPPHILWNQIGEVVITRIGGHMLFVPNIQELIGRWEPTDYYEADFNFISRTLENFRKADRKEVWVDDIVAEIRPYARSS